ncbi:MAG: phosphatidate cytidylyltransferase [Chlamydiia bacterium]
MDRSSLSRWLYHRLFIGSLLAICFFGFCWWALHLPPSLAPVVGLLVTCLVGGCALWEANRLIPEAVRPPTVMLSATSLLLWVGVTWQFAELALLGSVLLSLGWLASRLRRDVLAWGGFLIPFVWVALPFAAALYMWNSGADGIAWVLSSVICVKGADSAAYVGGLTLGRHALAPQWSPRKTWEGLGAALVGGALLGWLTYGLYIGLPTLWALGVGLGLALVGALGDLLESGIKRAANVKDSGRWGTIGGALDISDALLLAWPVLMVARPYLQSF